MKKNDVDIFDILIVLAKRKKFILIVTFLVTVIFIIYSLLATQYWISSVSFLTISQDRPMMPVASGLLGGFGSSILSQDRIGNLKSYLTILRSRSFSEEIIRRYDLIDYFKVKDPDSLAVMEKAIIDLHKKVLSTDYDIETGMISIIIETNDRYLSRDIAQDYFDMLEEYYLHSKMSKGRETRMFLERQIEEFEVNFAALSDKMEEFQTEHRLVDLRTQTEAVINLYAEVVSQKIETEIELEYARRYMAEDSQLIRSLAERLAVLNNNIKEMESSEADIVPRYILNIDDIPGITNQFAQLSLSLEIQRKVIEFLYPQYQSAKLDELNDISSFEIINHAVPAGLRSRPRRAFIVIVAFALSLFLSSLFAYTYEVLTKTPRKEKIDSFLHELLRK